MSRNTGFDAAIRLAEEKQVLKKQIEDLQAEVKELKKIRIALKRERNRYKKALLHVQETLAGLKISTPGDILYSQSGDLRVSHPADGC